MAKITVFTPTYNREVTLHRVYGSLLVQSLKDFIWLIIDDGSSDNTKELVGNWISEEKLKIKYYYKPNGGKHSAMKMANELCGTKYIIILDSDDTLVPSALSVFDQHWTNIESEFLEHSIAEIRAYSMLPTGEILGSYRLPDEQKYIDTTWQDMVLKNRNDNELICCWNLQKLKEIMNSQEEIWFGNRIKFIPEFVFWSRLGRLYKTRYIDASLRYYFTDADNSLLRSFRQSEDYYTDLVGNKYFLDENISYFFWRPKYFFSLLMKFGISAFILNISFFDILKAIHSVKFKISYIISYPFALVGFLYYSKIKKSYWG